MQLLCAGPTDVTQLRTAADMRVRLASGPEDLRAAQRLRYDVFVTELGAAPEGADHSLGLECDAFDAFADHLMLTAGPEETLVGVTRLLRPEQAQAAGSFYSEGEYDLTALISSGKRLLELSRTCLHSRFRGGMAMHQLWRGVASYVDAHAIELLFGVASFHGTDVATLRAPLQLLQDRHLAPPELRVTARVDALCGLEPCGPIDRRAAMLQVPSLIKAYLRLGATVGQGAFVDEAFNTTDLCLILDPMNLPDRQAAHYGRKQT